MNYKSYLVAATGYLIYCAPTYADSELPLEAVVVTASRTPVPIDQSGSSITVITRDEIEQRQVIHVADLLRGVPGLAVSRAGTFGSQTQVRVRGAEANHVLVFIDGVEANDPAIGDEFAFEHLTTYDIERIEIVRGPQSALWGSDALAGVIHITTRRGSGKFNATGQLEAGSFQSYYAGGLVSASGEKSKISLSVSSLDTEGSNISRLGTEDDGYRNTTVSASATTTPTPHTELEIFGRYTDASNEFDAIDFVVTGLPTDANRKTDVSQGYVKASGRLALKDSRWLHNVSVTLTSTDNDNFSDGATSGSTAADKYGISYQTSIDIDPEAANRGFQTLTFAIDHERQEFTQRGMASGFGDPNQDQDMETTGFVLEYLARPWNRMSLSTSVRHDTNSDFDDVTTYRATTSYVVPASKTQLRASVGSGQKSPTFVERFGFFPDTFVGNPGLEPEQSRGWDVGLLQPFRDGNLNIGLTYFREKLKDEINGFVFDPNLGVFTAENESGRSRRKGLEFTFDAAVANVLDVRASYTYTDATQPDPMGDDSDELRRPQHMASFNINYAFANRRGNLNVNASYTGKQVDIFFPPFPQSAESIELDDYTLVNLAASYKLNSNIDLYGRIENVFDERYEDVLGFATPGIGAFVGVRVQR